MDVTGGGNPPVFFNRFPDKGNSQCKVIRQEEHAQCTWGTAKPVWLEYSEQAKGQWEVRSERKRTNNYIYNPVGHNKDSGFYSKWNGESLRDFDLPADLASLSSLRSLLLLLWKCFSLSFSLISLTNPLMFHHRLTTFKFVQDPFTAKTSLPCQNPADLTPLLNCWCPPPLLLSLYSKLFALTVSHTFQSLWLSDAALQNLFCLRKLEGTGIFHAVPYVFSIGTQSISKGCLRDVQELGHCEGSAISFIGLGQSNGCQLCSE